MARRFGHMGPLGLGHANRWSNGRLKFFFILNILFLTSWRSNFDRIHQLNRLIYFWKLTDLIPKLTTRCSSVRSATLYQLFFSSFFLHQKRSQTITISFDPNQSFEILWKSSQLMWYVSLRNRSRPDLPVWEETSTTNRRPGLPVCLASQIIKLCHFIGAIKRFMLSKRNVARLKTAFFALNLPLNCESPAICPNLQANHKNKSQLQEETWSLN